MKTILIAVPTAKYIEPETMKSIYDLEIPDGYKTEFQFFFGYQIDQIRNLIAHWAQNYDYLFSVDSDITFPKDTLKRMLFHRVPIVSGLYIQRKPGEHILELYREGRNIPYNDIRGQGLIEVGGCGFGCVLIDTAVIKSIPYPQFVYKSAIDHRHTLSEDNYFCNKAVAAGYKIFADTNILCEHIGSTKFIVDADPPRDSFNRLMSLSNQRLLPRAHVDYLSQIKIKPKVVYDIGACVLHWTREAVNIWPEADFYACEAMAESKPIFEHFNIKHHIGLLSYSDGNEVDFHISTEHPGGNSYFPENKEIISNTPPREIRKLTTRSLDSVVEENGWPYPDLIKMDVQGAENDILIGAEKCLENATDLILELQRVEYNKGAPLKDSVIEYLHNKGFKLIGTGPFCDNGPDGDYHFTKFE